jgi:hypothetical protein
MAEGLSPQRVGAGDRPGLILVYGPPFSGTNEVAWAIARSMLSRSAVLSVDALLAGAIANPGEDGAAELEMVHGQVRLLAAYYLKQRYNLVVEGPFLFERTGALISFESHIDQLAALMRNLTRQSLVVRLDASADALRRRAESAGRAEGIESVLRTAAAYRPRSGLGVLSFNTGAHSAQEIAATVRAELAKGASFGRR